MLGYNLRSHLLDRGGGGGGCWVKGGDESIKIIKAQATHSVDCCCFFSCPFPLGALLVCSLLLLFLVYFISNNVIILLSGSIQ